MSRRPLSSGRSAIMRQVRRIVKNDERSVARAVWGTDLNAATWWRWTAGEYDPTQLLALEQVMRNYGFKLTLTPIEPPENAS